MTTLEKAARAICAKRCMRAQFLDAPCIDPDTGRNAPCRANEAQLTLTPGIWDGAEAALAVFSSALLDPSDELQEDLAEAFDAAFLPAWRECIAKHGTHNVFPAWASWGPKFLRAVGVKITGSQG